MASKEKFEYIAETSISEDLLCPICTDPFEEPVCSDQCGHTFCRGCISTTYKSLTSCPTCRTTLILEDYRPIVARPFLNQLNQLLVKCKECSQSNIQRGDFKKHLDKCVEAKGICSAASLGCEWNGKRSDMENHTRVCQLIKVKPFFEQLQDQVQQQSKQIKFLFNILSRMSNNHKGACTELYEVHDYNAICDVCSTEYNIQQVQSALHFCPQTDICTICVENHFK